MWTLFRIEFAYWRHDYFSTLRNIESTCAVALAKLARSLGVQSKGALLKLGCLVFVIYRRERFHIHPHRDFGYWIPKRVLQNGWYFLISLSTPDKSRFCQKKRLQACGYGGQNQQDAAQDLVKSTTIGWTGEMIRNSALLTTRIAPGYIKPRPRRQTSDIGRRPSKHDLENQNFKKVLISWALWVSRRFLC